MTGNLLEKDGVLVDTIEVRDKATGAHHLISLTQKGGLHIHVLRWGSEFPTFPIQILLPGEDRLATAGGIRLLIQWPPGIKKLRVEIPVITTATRLAVIFRYWQNIQGDLEEEYAERKRDFGAFSSRCWYCGQFVSMVIRLANHIVRVFTNENPQFNE